MGQRLAFQSLLETLLGSRNVYFQPPANIQLKYPCIIYNRDYAVTQYADNNPYRFTKRYLLTVIDQDPDSLIPEKIAALPMCEYNRFFASDNLNHDVFKIFF